MKTFDLSTFFRLLAEENITIIEGDFPTASADVINRVMRIPAFSKESEGVRVLFGAHEVAHFKWTPQDLMHEIVKRKYNSGLRMCVNIIEDIRIEKLLKNRYPGLIDYMQKGYSELLTKGFFGDIHSYNGFANKVNLKSKVSSMYEPKFNGRDLAMYHYLQSIIDSKDTVKFAKILYAYDAQSSQEQNNDLDFDEIMKKIKDMIASGEIDFSGDLGDGDSFGQFEAHVDRLAQEGAAKGKVAPKIISKRQDKQIKKVVNFPFTKE